MIAAPVFFALSLATSTGWPASNPAAASPAPSPAASPSPAEVKGQELNIIYTTNIIGEIDPCG